MTRGQWCSCSVVVGAAAGVLTDAQAPPALGMALLAVALLLVRPRLWTAVVSAALVAMWWGSEARSDVFVPPPWAQSADTVDLTGVLTADASLSPSGVRLELRVDRWRVRLTVVGALAVDRMAEWTRGRVVRLPARVRAPDVVRNPGSPSIRWQHLTRRFDAIGSVKSGALVESGTLPVAEDLAGRVRARVRHTVARHFSQSPDDTRAIVTAILIGDRAGLDTELTRRLQAAGVFHVIAISGGNVAMLAAVCLGLCRVTFRGVRPALVVTIAVVAMYGFIVGDDPSVLRAVTAAIAYFCLRLAGLTPAPLSLFAAVAAANVLIDPLCVVDVAAWLSFGATFGLLVVLPRLWRATVGPPSLEPSRIMWPRRVVIGGVLATAAAELVILPVSASVFGRVGIAGLVMNLLAVPAMALVQFGGLMLCVADLIGIGTGVLSSLTSAGVHGLLATASAIELAPWLSWRTPPPPMWALIAYAIAGTTALAASSRRVRRGTAGAAAALLVVMALAPWPAWKTPSPGWLRVTMLDVGQGDATLVQTPDGHALLVDAGGTPSGTFDVGGRVVTPAVWASGVRRLDWLLLTHGDLDHVGGAASVITDLRPREIWEGIPVDDDPALRELRARAHREGIAWRRMLDGHALELGGVTIRVRHPQTPDWQRIRVRNDDSVVLEIVYGRVSVLLPGDAGVEFERAAADPSPRTRLRVLKVGHHGSRTSTSPAFLDRWLPNVAVISAGAHNLFGHPAPAVLDELRVRGVPVFRTDRHGAIIVETDGAQVRVTPVAGRWWWGR